MANWQPSFRTRTEQLPFAQRASSAPVNWDFRRFHFTALWIGIHHATQARPNQIRHAGTLAWRQKPDGNLVVASETKRFSRP